MRRPSSLPSLEQLHHEPMRRLEHRVVLHAERGEVVHVEEAAIVDVVGGHAPVSEPIALPLEQVVQRVEARADCPARR